jgi:hypothetical protein
LSRTRRAFVRPSAVSRLIRCSTTTGADEARREPAARPAMREGCSPCRRVHRRSRRSSARARTRPVPTSRARPAQERTRRAFRAERDARPLTFTARIVPDETPTEMR